MPRLETIPVNNFYYRKNCEPQEKPMVTIGIVDDLDDIVEQLALLFSDLGHRVRGFVVNEKAHPTDLQQRELAAQIAESGIDLAIVDVGLGLTDGIKISRRLKESGIPTILLTGAGIRPSAEPTDYADKIVLKPASIHELIDTCTAMLGISPAEM